MTPTPAPKFKVGDKVLWMGSPIVHEIAGIEHDGFQANYELIFDGQNEGDRPEWALEEELRDA